MGKSYLSSILYEPKKYFAFTFTLFGIIPLLIVALSSFRTDAMTIQSTRDCDANAVIRCGARSFDELQTRYSQPDVAEIYSSFGISDQDIANVRDNAVEGQVTRNGDVLVNGEGVATDAMTAGRQNMAGSKAVNSGGVIYYRRPPSVSFLSSSEPAFVAMKNGQFMYAILASCGNPVIATPVTKQKQPTVSTSTKTTTTTTTQPSVSVTNNNTNNNSNTNTVTTTTPAPVVYTYTPPTYTAPTQTAAPQPAAQPAAQPAPTYTAPAPVAQQPAPAATSPGKTLPNTGPGDVLKLSGTAMVLSTVGHIFYQRRRLRF
jgi:hypothetical protein